MLMAITSKSLEKATNQKMLVGHGCYTKPELGAKNLRWQGMGQRICEKQPLADMKQICVWSIYCKFLERPTNEQLLI